jgi:hypothetical protein
LWASKLARRPVVLSRDEVRTPLARIRRRIANGEIGLSQRSSLAGVAVASMCDIRVQ